MKKLLSFCLMIVVATTMALSQTQSDFADFLRGDCSAFLVTDFGLTFERTDRIIQAKGLLLKNTFMKKIEDSERGTLEHKVGVWENLDGSLTMIVMFDQTNASWFVTFSMKARSVKEAKKMTKDALAILEKSYPEPKIKDMFTKVCETHILCADLKVADDNVIMVLLKKKLAD